MLQVNPSDPTIAAFQAIDAFKTLDECKAVLVTVAKEVEKTTFTCMGFLAQGKDI
jgi:hypothetical protein